MTITMKSLLTSEYTDVATLMHGESSISWASPVASWWGREAFGGFDGSKSTFRDSAMSLSLRYGRIRLAPVNPWIRVY